MSRHATNRYPREIRAAGATVRTRPWPLPGERLPADLTLAAGQRIELAAAEATEDGKPKLRTFTGTAYTGAEMVPEGFYRPVMVDLAGLAVPRQTVPILRGHDPEQVLGHTQEIKVDGRVEISGVFSGATRAAEVVELAAGGFPWQLSIGARIEKLIRLDDGEKADVNGRQVTGPLLIARKTTLREVSFVPIGADGATSAKIAAQAANSISEEGAMDFQKWLKAKGWDPESLSDDQRAVLEAAWKSETNQGSKDEGGEPKPQKIAAAAGNGQPDDEKPVDLVAQARAELAAESKRVAAIRKITAGHDELQAKAIEEGWTSERTELEILRAERGRGPAIHTGGEDQQPAVLEAALARSAGVDQTILEADYSEQTLEAADGRQYRAYGLGELLHAAIGAAGGYARPGRITDETIRSAFDAERTLRASGSSTFSLSGILGAVANKSLRAGYQSVDNVAARIARIGSVSNFQTHTRYLLTAKGEVEKVGADGELKHGKLTEENYTISADTYGRLIGLSRTALVNDDMDALSQIPRDLGRKAVLALQKALFTAILGNASSFFGSGNSNYISGASTTLQISSLTTAEQTFMDQTDADGDPVGITPAILLVPTALKVAAQEIYAAVRVNEYTSQNKKSPDINPHAGKWRVECSPYLSNSNLTGYSSTAWYLLADPADVAAFEVAFLNGMQEPQVATSDLDFDQLGIQHRVVYDFGVALADHRGGVMSKGAA